MIAITQPVAIRAQSGIADCFNRVFDSSYEYLTVILVYIIPLTANIWALKCPQQTYGQACALPCRSVLGYATAYDHPIVLRLQVLGLVVILTDPESQKLLSWSPWCGFNNWKSVNNDDHGGNNNRAWYKQVDNYILISKNQALYVL